VQSDLIQFWFPKEHAMSSLGFGDNVLVEYDGHVAVVTINRPPHNHVTTVLLAHLADAFENIDKIDEIRASVLRTEGRSFCAGADLNEDDEVLGPITGGINPLYAQAVRLFRVRKPIVAAIQGAAVGAGLGLALVADFRVAAREARFVANFVSLGFHPGFGLTHTLPRLIGQQRANLMFLTGRRMKAEEAKDYALVDQVTPLVTLREAALSLAREIAANAPLAVAATRATLRRELAAAVCAQTTWEDGEQKRLRLTEDFAEGIRAVRERRPGNFRGR
jgi:enoyl-CoA hydratase/carnithine racemase